MKKIRINKQTVVPGKWLAGLAFFLLFVSAVKKDLGTSDTSIGTAVGQSVAEGYTYFLYDMIMPSLSMRQSSDGVWWFVQSSIEGMVPLYGMARREVYATGANKAQTEEKEEGQASNVLKYEDFAEEWSGGTAGIRETEEGDREQQELLKTENEAAMDTVPFVIHDRKVAVNLEELEDYETLVKTFYTIDANTVAGSDQLDVRKLLGRDMTIDREVEGPQILIYHTHSQEAFADSVPGDDSTGILGVGERLAEILRTEYGYQVLHHMGRYDVASRDNAYGSALPELERLLAENPSIQVVIDLHRDQMPEETRLVMNLDGRPTARFMFFNGLSRTRKTGDITYLKNENIADNLAFSFQMQLAAQEYYPGLTRKIYLKGYRYNMHVCPKTLLVELGAQNNTVEEAMNACDPLAHMLDLVIGGERGR